MAATFFFCALLCVGISLLLAEYVLGKPDNSVAEAMGAVLSVAFTVVAGACLLGFITCLYTGA
mgnify:CR=1 FL=1